VVHYAAPNGMLYPFCTYNSGPTFRKMIETEFSQSIEGSKKGERFGGSSVAFG